MYQKPNGKRKKKPSIKSYHMNNFETQKIICSNYPNKALWKHAEPYSINILNTHKSSSNSALAVNYSTKEVKSTAQHNTQPSEEN